MSHKAVSDSKIKSIVLERPGKPSVEEFSHGWTHLGDGNYSTISICTHISTGQIFALKSIEKQKVILDPYLR